MLDKDNNTDRLMDHEEKNLVIVVVVLGLIQSGICMQYAFAEPFRILTFRLETVTESIKYEFTIHHFYYLLFLVLPLQFLVLMTSFTRIVIVLRFCANIFGYSTNATQSGFDRTCAVSDIFHYGSDFLDINEAALQPYLKGEITQTEAFKSSYTR